jgi:tRNA threonylcarbamoyladenosine biosynthesis protein TsaB
MKILAVDTSTEACSAALAVGSQVWARGAIAPRGHAQLILPMIEELLAEGGLALPDLDAIAFGRGPGAFTGVRIATAVVQGLAFGADLPVVPVSTLAALAQGVCRELGHERVLAAIDARIEEVYWGAYRLGPQGLVEPAGAELVCLPSDVPVPAGGGWFGAGSGWGAYGQVLGARLGSCLAGFDARRYPHAHDVALLGAAGLRDGAAVPAERALPVYLRDKVAWKK